MQLLQHDILNINKLTATANADSAGLAANYWNASVHYEFESRHPHQSPTSDLLVITPEMNDIESDNSMLLLFNNNNELY